MFGLIPGDGPLAGQVVLGWRKVVEAGGDLSERLAPAASASARAYANLTAQEKLALLAQGVGVREATAAADLEGTMDAQAMRAWLATVAADLQLSTSLASGAKAASAFSTSLAGVATFDAEAQTGVEVRAAEEPNLEPLTQSWAQNDIEDELRTLFKALFDGQLRPKERYVNLLGIPHLGTTELLQASLAADGLAIYRGAGSYQGAALYLLKAWRAHNPKRGLHLLKAYLQLLWPNVWKCTQMWQDKSLPYPEGLSETDGGNHFLTSRVHVSLPARVTTGGDLAAVQHGLRAVIPARFVLNFSIEQEQTSTQIYAGATMTRGRVFQSYEGTAT